ncbi:hypothetical protein J2Z60_001086 [Lactobacillus colini]|uniref:XkdX family protein n=1 Tax=Lactobacillus colini TaxID=1819254 RepID=A0ABS4ME32_9LACO|nr:XkdX family protein [Lactobacillus colini]MBP2057911.1 hypothetical protein [Lactobacillus colini]
MTNFLELIHENNVVFYTCGYAIGMYSKQEIADLIKRDILYQDDYKKIVGEDYPATA